MKQKGSTRGTLIALFSLLLIMVSSCASAPGKNTVLALVDGDPVTRDDLEYSLQIAHRREDLSRAGELDIPQYVQQLIDDRLIMHEARTMGLDNAEAIKDKVSAYILRGSVLRLYNDEIVSRAEVTEDEIVDYYRQNYEKFIVDIIEVSDEEEARGILEKLKAGESFREFSRTYPSQFPGSEQGEIQLSAASLGPEAAEVLRGLASGEFSGVLQGKDVFHIIRLIGRQDAPGNDLEDRRETIEGTLRKEKIDLRSNEYLAELRSAANISVNEKILPEINLAGGKQERDRWAGDERTLASVNGENLGVGEFVAMVPPLVRKPADDILNNWISRKLVDREALRRDYVSQTGLREEVARYENQLLKNSFFRDVIAAQIIITEEEQREYYRDHQENYMTPVEYRIQQISLNSRERADEVRKGLLEGANFSWLARKSSMDAYAEQGGVAGWKKKDALDDPVAAIIEGLRPGDISPVIKNGELFVLVRLMEIREPQAEDFETVRPVIFRELHSKKFRDMYNNYVRKLRAEARIEINDSAVESFGQMIRK